jgi:hypothetical protein
MTRLRFGFVFVATVAFMACTTPTPPPGAPVVSAEREVTRAVNGAADNAQRTPDVAFGRNSSLVVWQDDRNDTGATGTDIWAARVDPTGRPIERTGIAISTAPSNQFVPRVAFDGSEYLVVWQDVRSNSGYDVYGARVSVTGEVLDPGGIPISTAADNQQNPDVVADGSGFFVVWDDARAGRADVRGTRVTDGGLVQDPTGIPISAAAGDQLAPAIAFDGHRLLVVWEDDRNLGTSAVDVFGARVSTAGTVLDPAGIPIATSPDGERRPAVAAGVKGFLVAWTDVVGTDEDARSAVLGVRVDGAGTVEAPDPIPISTGPRDAVPSVAFDGTRYVVSYLRSRSEFGPDDVMAQGVTGAGAVVGTPRTISTQYPNQAGPAITFGGGTFFVTWDASPGAATRTDVYDTQFAFGATGTPVVLVSRAANRTDAPVVTFDGSDYFVVWNDFRSGNCELFGAPLPADAPTFKPVGTRITSSSDCGTANVAFDGTNFLVVWSDTRNLDTTGDDIYAARVNRSGHVLDPGGIPVSTASGDQQAPVVAFDGTNSLVAWQDSIPGVATNIRGARVARTGVVLDGAPIAISPPEGTESGPAIAFNGVTYFVVWSKFEPLGTDDIVGTRVTKRGVVVDPAGRVISGNPSLHQNPSVTAIGTTFVVAWDDLRNAGTHAVDIYAARVNANAVVLDPAGIPIATSSVNDDASHVAVNRDALIVWTREGATNDVLGARLRADGTVLDPGGFPIATFPQDERVQSVSRATGDDWIVAYQRFVPNPPYSVVRARLRTVTPTGS